MESGTQIDRPLEINPQTNRRDAAGEQIKHYIRANRMKPGARLPTVRQLSEHFALSRDAIWRALKQLNDEQWLDLQPNKRYTVSEAVYKTILQSLRVKAVFSGKRYIYFSGFRRLSDALAKECHYQNIDLSIELLPLLERPTREIFDKCDLLLVDSDSSGPVIERFKEFPVPVIGLDADYSERYRANIVTDHHLGGRMAAEAILKKGVRHATVVYFGGSEDNPRISARIDGFRQAWLEAGRAANTMRVVPISWSRSTFKIALNALDFLKAHPPKGSYFVTDGRLAASFLEVLAYLEVPVPDEVGLIGFDGAQMGQLTDPPMTTIQQAMESIAHGAVEWLRAIGSGEEKKGSLERIAPVFVERDSF